jgi:hypothetical protein
LDRVLSLRLAVQRQAKVITSIVWAKMNVNTIKLIPNIFLQEFNSTTFSSVGKGIELIKIKF